MKCKNISSKINSFVVQKLKKIKINGQTSTMPTMPKEKSSPISITENKDSEINKTVKKSEIQQKDNKIVTMKVATTTTTTTTTLQTPNNPYTNGIGTKRTANDFRFGKSIGEGSFSTVYLAKDIHTSKEYAIKVCEKQHIIREKKQEYMKREKEVMNKLTGVPGFVNLFCTFQDHRSLYFAMTYAKNGDLLPYINKVGSFDVECTKFYVAELVLALENMHKRNIIHRDLKPENILLDENMHSLIADFGSAKILGCNLENIDDDENDDDTNDSRHRRRKNSFVGTAQYVSPEVLRGKAATKSTDLWALGCIIYQMISGLPPFRAATEYLIFQKISNLDLKFPEGFDKNAEDLVEKLLRVEPNLRIGANDLNDRYISIRSHPFFDDIDWSCLRSQQPPQIYPYLPGEELRSHYRIPDHLEPGLDDKQLTRLLGLELGTSDHYEAPCEPKSIANIPALEKQKRLEIQRCDKWNQFVDGELILKQGFINKRKGLFARKRMLLLTTGPRLFYIDPVQMVKKGEIPWSPELRVEPKNFKIFFVHTPNRTYYLEDAEGYALEWCQAIEDVRLHIYGNLS